MTSTVRVKKYTKITEVNLSAFIYRLFHEDFSSKLGTNPTFKRYIIQSKVFKASVPVLQTMYIIIGEKC